MSAGRPAPTSSYGWRIASVHGIPVYLGRSWPVVAAVIVLTFGPQVSHPTTLEQGGTFGYAVAVAYALLLLFSVLTHEAAHAVVARRSGYRVDRVVADLWGGHTVYDSSTSRPGASAAIAVAGPLANLALAAMSYLLVQSLGDGGVVGLLLGALMLTNFFVGLFNLLPGLPLDGGFLVDALVWKASGDRNKGLIVAGWLGRVVTVAIVLWLVGRPLLQGDQPSLFTIVWSGLIGAFLWAGATNAIRAGKSRQVIERVLLAQVLRPVLVVSTTDSAEHVLSRVPPADAGPGRTSPTVVAVGPGGPAGFVDVDALREVDPGRRGDVPVAAVLARQPDGWVVVADPGADVSGVISAIVARQQAGGGDSLRVVLVVDPAGQLLGTVSVADLNAAFG
jgi:Zn-dependent protease